MLKKTKWENDITDEVWEDRAIDRFVNYQIKTIIGNKSIGDVFYINKDGILMVNTTCGLSNEMIDELNRLISLNRDGVFRKHQFIDFNSNSNETDKFNTWFDEEAMNTYMYSIPSKEIFCNIPDEEYESLIKTHSLWELNRENFSGYSIWQTLYALDKMNPVLIATILGNNIDIILYEHVAYLKFDYEGRTLYSDIYSNYLFVKNNDNKFEKIDETIHTLLFKHYKKPIYSTINSIMFPLEGNRVMPSEGLYKDPMDDDLVSKVYQITESENYKTLKKSYVYPRSRVDGRY